MDTRVDHGADPERHASETAEPRVRERWEVRRIEDAPPSSDRPEAKRRPDDQHKAEASEEKDPAQDARKRRQRLLIGGIVALVLLIGAAIYLWHWYSNGRFMVETDDAYTQADNVTVSPQVAGYVVELRVGDNQRVRRGDVLLRIDDRTYRAQVVQASGDLASARANVRNAEAQIVLQQAVIVQAEAGLGSAQAAERFAQQEMTRYGQLAKTGAGSVQREQQAEAQLRQATADRVRAEAALETERKRLGVLETQKEQAEAAVIRAQGALDQAQVNLDNTVIAAPIDGVVGDRSARLGLYAQPATRLLTIVPMDDVYIVANYKETQLERMHDGQPVTFKVDAYPGVKVRGHVDSLAPGSGAVFALLPPENATGNFTKIVQRVPVKIVVDGDDPLKGRLRPGLSVLPTVDTRDTRGTRLEERPPQDGRPPPPGS